MIKIENETEIEVLLKVSLDSIDKTILKIFQSNPFHWYRLREISAILSYEGMEVSTQKLAKKLEFFATLDMVQRTRRGRYYSYSNKD